MMRLQPVLVLSHDNLICNTYFCSMLKGIQFKNKKLLRRYLLLGATFQYCGHWITQHHLWIMWKGKNERHFRKRNSKRKLQAGGRKPSAPFSKRLCHPEFYTKLKFQWKCSNKISGTKGWEMWTQKQAGILWENVYNVAATFQRGRDQITVDGLLINLHEAVYTSLCLGWSCIFAN